MRCDAVLEILLEADPGILRRGDHGGAEHVARCPECRRAVDRILEGEHVLDRWLSTSPGPDTQAILAGTEAEAVGSGPDAGTRRSGRWSGRRVARAAAWIALAAAAVATVFLVDDPAPRPGPATLDGPPAAPGTGEPDRSSTVALGGADPAPPPPTPEVEVPADRSAAILRTGDPDITVIWFYGGDR